MPSSTPKACSVEPFPIWRVAEVDPLPPENRWLVEQIWLASGVGLVGGEPKLGKTHLAVELSFAVATGRPALGHFATHVCGPVLIFAAEHSLPSLRERFEDLAKLYKIPFEDLQVYLLEATVLRLDNEVDLQRLRASIERCAPRLLVLDPFVRIARIDENSAAEVSAVLDSLRVIQRTYDLPVLVVHHTRKSPAAHPNQAFRGSSDFAAWSDSNLLLTRKAKHIVLTAEHRSARSPEPILLKLIEEPAPHLVVVDAEPSRSKQAEPNPLATAIHHQLEGAARPLSTVELRERLRRRKTDVVHALELLRAAGVVRRTPDGWQLHTRE